MNATRQPPPFINRQKPQVSFESSSSSSSSSVAAAAELPVAAALPATCCPSAGCGSPSDGATPAPASAAAAATAASSPAGNANWSTPRQAFRQMLGLGTACKRASWRKAALAQAHQQHSSSKIKASEGTSTEKKRGFDAADADARGVPDIHRSRAHVFTSKRRTLAASV